MNCFPGLWKTPWIWKLAKKGWRGGKKKNLSQVSSHFIKISIPEGKLDNFHYSTAGKLSLVLSPRLRTFFSNTMKQTRLKKNPVNKEQKSVKTKNPQRNHILEGALKINQEVLLCGFAMTRDSTPFYSFH